MAGDPRPSRQPQAGAAPDAPVGTGGDLPAPEYEQAGSGTQDLSLPAARARDRAGHQVWCSDITYIPMAKGFLYLVVIMDWVSRAVLAWRLSNTLGAEFCVEALEQALSQEELSPNLGDGLRDQAAAVWDCEDAGLAATSIPSVNLTP